MGDVLVRKVQWKTLPRQLSWGRRPPSVCVWTRAHGRLRPSGAPSRLPSWAICVTPMAKGRQGAAQRDSLRASAMLDFQGFHWHDGKPRLPRTTAVRCDQAAGFWVTCPAAQTVPFPWREQAGRGGREHEDDGSSRSWFSCAPSRPRQPRPPTPSPAREQGAVPSAHCWGLLCSGGPGGLSPPAR